MWVRMGKVDILGESRRGGGFSRKVNLNYKKTRMVLMGMLLVGVD